MLPYSEVDKKSIRYEMKRMEDGWALAVTLPAKISTDDNAKVLNWIRQYEETVKRQRPEWLVNFRVTTCGYVLYMQPYASMVDLLKMAELSIAGEKVREYWSKTIECA